MSTESQRQAKAEYQRRWRARQGARTGQLGRRPVQPCGTLAAYRRHLDKGEEPCAECRAANAEYSRQARAKP
jgi:hypothetical protein